PANKDSNIADSTYCYVSSCTCWQDDFDLATDTYESYAKRTHLGKQLFIKVFRTSGKASKRNLNYRIQ
ncbi:MAG: radical SAM protein, partial [Dysgonamonadaceae bacterium]|nr:radical SAM protein [Dysgonamonadaceae bacterium]